MRSGLFARERHGDADVEPGLIDFAVNVRGGPPEFLRAALAARLDDLGAYPTAADEARAVAAIAALHDRTPDEVLLLAGAAEGFELLPRLRPRHAALLQPSFTEPELALRAAGIPVTDVVAPEPWLLDPKAVPAEADLVVFGNPTNPTSVLHPVGAVGALRRPGRIVVVDEAFADITLDVGTGVHEPASVASRRLDDVIVIRSVTKTFGLAGLRAGYLLGHPDLIARLQVGRRPWPLGTLALTALAECAGPAGQRFAREQARIVADDRAAMVGQLGAAGIEVCGDPRASYVLIRIDGALEIKKLLRNKGFGVRSAANFAGLDERYLRLAVRDPATVATLIDAIERAGEEVGR